MMIETSLVAYLSDLAPNLYPQAAPLGYSVPAVIYNRASTVPVEDMDGDISWGWVVLQIDVYDPSYLAAKELAHDIRNHLVVWDDDGVQSVTWSGETDSIDETTDDQLHRVMLTFSVFCAL